MDESLMTTRQQMKSEFVGTALKKSPLSRNQIAAVSGLSNAYIRELEKGGIGNVGREKLIAFAIALNLSLTEIDDMLRVFDRAALAEDDIPVFIQASERSRISAALHPIRDSFTFDIAILSAERIPGDHVIVSPRPASCLRAEGHRAYAEKSLAAAHRLYADLVEAINRERRKQLMANLADHAVRQFVCINCLTDYIRECTDAEEKRWRQRHVRNAVNIISSFERYEFYLTRECPSFIFVMRTPPPDSGISEKLIITVLPPHRLQVRTSGLLAGFATDNHAVILNFKEELTFIRESIIEDYLDRQKLIDFLVELSD
jgi:transcriptional regulator with XRE-family HTH domain